MGRGNDSNPACISGVADAEPFVSTVKELRRESSGGGANSSCICIGGDVDRGEATSGKL